MFIRFTKVLTAVNTLVNLRSMGKAVEVILKILQAGAEGTVTLMDAMLVGHASSPRPYYRMKHEPARFQRDWAELYKRRQSFYSLINQLKREELVRKVHSKKGTLWSLTRQGRERLTAIWLRNSRKSSKTRNEPLLPKKKYKVAPTKNLVIVAFDIPEYARKRRNWLRAYLVGFGFKKLQQSVWAGNCGVPEEFLHDLKSLNMLPWVHVFQVTKRGTVAEMAPDKQ